MGTFLLGLGLIVGIVFIWIYFQVQQEEKEQNIAELRSITSRLMDHLTKVNDAKTVKTKVSNCEKAIDLLYQARSYENHSSVITNFDELWEKLPSMKKVLPVADEVQKADKNKFKGKKSAEKNNLLNALYEIETNDITNEDFEIVPVFDDDTGEVLTVEAIESRLKDLGWERPTE